MVYSVDLQRKHIQKPQKQQHSKSSEDCSPDYIIHGPIGAHCQIKQIPEQLSFFMLTEKFTAQNMPKKSEK